MDDEGFGYKDHGGEIWDTNEEGRPRDSKRRKLARDQEQINQYIVNNAQKKKVAPQARKPAAKVTEQESKDIMNQLYNDLDAEEGLEEHRMADAGPAAFSKQEAVMQQYAVAAPTLEGSKPKANPFAKKRTADQMTSQPQTSSAPAEDVEMASEVEEQKAKPEDESMATDNFHSAIDDSKVLAAAKEATMEDEWEKLKI